MTASPEAVFRKTVVGVGSLVLRQALSFPLGLLMGIVIARCLTASEFGIFATAAFVITAASGLSELGLNQAIIQRSAAPTNAQLHTFFTFRAGVLGLMGMLLVASASLLATWFNLGQGGAGLIRLLALSFVMTALGSPSQAALTRDLAYPILARIEFLQSAIYQILGIVLLVSGYGIWGLAFAMLISEAVRAGLLMAGAPHAIGAAWEPSFLRYGLRYGGLIYVSGLTHYLRDNIPVLLVGPLFGSQAVGYLRWAERMATQLSQVFAAIVTKVSFASAARLPDSAALSRMTETTVRYVNIATLPLLATFCALAPEIVTLVYSDRWFPAIPAFYLIVLRMIAANLTTPLDGVLRARGLAAVSLRITVTWTLLEWIGALIAVSLTGYLGVAISYAIVDWLAAGWFLVATMRVAKVDLKYCVLRPAFAAGCTTAALVEIKSTWVQSIPTLVLAGAIGLVLFWLVLFAIERMKLTAELQSHFVWVRDSMGGKPV